MSGLHAHPHLHAHTLPSDATTLHRLDARAKVITLITLVVVAVSTPPSAFAVTALYFAMLAALMGWARVPPRTLALRIATVLPFVGVVAIFIPFMPSDEVGGGLSLGIGELSVSRSGLLICWNVLWKALFGVLCLTLLSVTTPFAGVLQALEQLRVPQVLVMMASFTHRYAFVLVDEVQRMKRARDARGWQGRWVWHARTIGQLAGVFFLRSYERSERIHLAMLARGFDGRPTTLGGSELEGRDVAFATVLIATFLTLRLAAR